MPVRWKYYHFLLYSECLYVLQREVLGAGAALHLRSRANIVAVYSEARVHIHPAERGLGEITPRYALRCCDRS